MSNLTIGQIQFIQNHQTALDAGEYEITVTQAINIKNQGPDEEFRSTLKFAIQGSRFGLQPQDIHAVFPPENSLGDHSNVLPHIVLESSTLPWERLVHSHARQETPWLALLLFHEGEKLLRTIQRENFFNAKFHDPQGKKISDDTKVKLWQYLLSNNVSWLQLIEDDEAIIVEKEARETPSLSGDFAMFDSQVEALLSQVRDIKLVVLKKLSVPSQGTIKWPGIELEIGQEEKDQVSVIDISKKLLSQILPTTQELEYLAHVRQTIGDPESSEPLSVVVSNRLPKQNGTSTAYLVTLENRYSDSDTFHYQDATGQDYIRLVVLKSWSFACSEPEQDFKGLLSKLHVGTLQLPKLSKPDADKYLEQGYVALPHYLRQGGKTFSWYHSPLLPGENKTGLELSQFAVRCADQLIAYDESNGLFDVTYAAAWQLGQLLALQNKKMAINLFDWKRKNAQKLAKDNQQALYSHLFPADSQDSGGSIDLPEDINTWFRQLALLSGIPFNYLVPHDEMLPPESIRFFWLDWFWVESLLDGAFSIGRVHESKPESDTLPSQVRQITGCLIRSEVIAGWPDLQIDASNSRLNGNNPMQANQKQKLLRCDRLSQDVLICLFEGEIQTLDISLKPEGLHFGFNLDEAKKLRSIDDEENSDWKIKSIPWKDKNTNQRIVDIDKLAKTIEQKLKGEKERLTSFTSAQFALKMVQGAELVRFLIAESSATTDEIKRPSI